MACSNTALSSSATKISRTRQMLAFMSNFGTPCVDPFAAVEQPVPPEFTIVDMQTLPYKRATSLWHYDSSVAAEPGSIISLRAVEVPAVGGDTCWSSMYAAYDALSEPLRNMLDGLRAAHSGVKTLSLMKVRELRQHARGHGERAPRDPRGIPKPDERRCSSTSCGPSASSISSPRRVNPSWRFSTSM